MNRLNIFLAFALGCLLSWSMGPIAIDAHAQGPSQGGNIQVCVDKNGVLRMSGGTAACPNGQRSLIIKNATSSGDTGKPQNTTPDDITLDRKTLEDINRRLIKLEEMGCAALGKRRVVAPFEVDDASGKKMFSVLDDALGGASVLAGVFDGGATPVSAIVADQSGGFFSARGGDLRVSFGFSPPSLAGLIVSEKGKTMIELGKRQASSTYRLTFVSSSNELVAGIGQSLDSRAGLVLINDGTGRQRAVMEVTKAGRGRFGIMNGGDKPIAALSEGDQGGGVFYICAAGGSCDPPMVSAGTNDRGVGVVATGPRFYSQGLTGASGSFLVGK